MSYDIYLTSPATGKLLELPEKHQLEGGMYIEGGSTLAWLNVTYNYAEHYYRLWPEEGIRVIYGLTGKQSLPFLEHAADQLIDDTCPDYWQPTEGNARRALLDLAQLARMAPHGVWQGD